MINRLSRSALVAAMAIYMTLVVVNNVLDYQTNFEFVRHVLSMDTVFPGSSLKSRSITNATLHHLAYGFIIVWESLTAGLCWYGAWRMGRAVTSSDTEFCRSRSWGELGLVWALLLWFVGFLSVGGEWFVMWQSTTWNGQNAAFRMFAVTGIILIYVRQAEDTSNAK